MSRLDHKLAALATLSPAQLREEWLSMFSEEAPDFPPSMMRRVIAYRLQEQELGGLQFLAPDIVTAILEGRQPIELNTRTLLRTSELPIEWKEQRKVLGFA
nr:DUF2924 domain-containing protein [Sphingomonas sp. Y57]